MPRQNKIRLIITLILLVQQSSKLSLPMTSSSTMIGSISLKELNEDSLQLARFVKITWRIQKNHQNGQSVTLTAESDQPKICPVHSAMQLVLRARWLNQPDDIPIASYKTKKCKVNYLTGNKITELLWKAVKKVRRNTTPDKLKQYYTHSLQVWNCILLDEARKLPDYIKKRLRWLGDSFRMYLRDTAIIQHQHVDALPAALQELMDLITNFPKDIIALSTMTEGTDDPDMHKYTDKMDQKTTSSQQTTIHLISLLTIPLKSHPLNLPILHNRTW
jgi:hypothetical protein